MPEQNQPVNTLPIKTVSGMAATDYLLGIGSTEEYQMLIQDLGDYIIQHATSLLAGQNRTLANAISDLNSKTYSLSGGTVITNNTDLNTIKTVGNYYSYNNISIVNGPFGTFSGILKVAHSAGQSDGYLRQTIVRYNLNDKYERIYNATQWSDWEKVPTRAEITALNSKHIILGNVAGDTESVFVKNLCTALNLPNDLHTYTFSATWQNNGYVAGFVRRVRLSGGYNGIFKLSMGVASESKEYSFWSWDSVTFYADQIPTRAEFNVLNSERSNTAGYHNGIYRGKNITSYLTDGSLWNRIKGEGGYALFADLYLGDYITVGSNIYVIVDFDYYLRCGSEEITEHHVVMMPNANMNIPEGTALYGISGQTLQFINTANAGVSVSSQETATAFKWNAKMSDPNTSSTNGGYKYSRMRQVIMKAANTIVINAFGSSHVKPISVLYPNPSSETASGIASNWAWFANDDQSAADAKSLCDLPNETQIYGQQVWGRGTVYTNMGFEIGADKFQFAICTLQRNFVDIRANGWLRSVNSDSNATRIINYGTISPDGTANARGVRPRFLLVG